MGATGPPPPGGLTRLPRRRLAGLTLHRIFRQERGTPWRFVSLNPDRSAEEYGRFDLPAPEGTCYLARTPVAAALEVFQEHDGLLPDVELRRRLRAEVLAPSVAPDAADLSARASRGVGVTAALWSGGNRPVSQQWAVALRRAGWLALHHGIAHDPSGRQRAVSLFDRSGEHPPYDDPDGWAYETHDLAGDADLVAALATYGIEVVRSDPQLPLIDLADSGLV